MAIKSGKRLYATDANGTWFVKQATSPKQFQLLCIKEELEKNGYSVPKAGRYLYAPDVPDPDLVIRTSGEVRTSNFLLWESAYSEYHFTDVLWPDFSEADLDRALEDYAARHRRQGGI